MTNRKQKDWIKIAVWLWIIMMCFAKNTAYAQKEKADRTDPIVSRVIVDVQGINGEVGRWVDLVKSLIFIQEGEAFSTKQFQDSIEALKSSKIFKAIHVFEKSVKENQLELHFQVTPIRGLKILKSAVHSPCWNKKSSTPCSLEQEMHTIRRGFPPKRLPLSSFSKMRAILLPSLI